LMLDSGVTRDRYYYDDNGNVSYITDEQEGISTRSLAYDGLDRLVTANSNTWGAGSFSYDALDNIRTSNVGSRSLTHNIDSATNRLTSLSGSQSVGFSYDANGNITQRAGQQFVFDIGNRMSSAPGKATYSYDGHGRRAQANMADGVWRLWAYTSDGKLRLDHRSGKGATRYVYLGSKLIAESANYDVAFDPGLWYGTSFLHTDALGSPVAKTNLAGQLLTPVRTSYEPYGATWSGPNPTKLGYTGHVNDVDTGLVQMQQRYYDPIAGRFLSVDPVVTDADTGSSFNRYIYAENNPFTFIDPDGMQATPGDDRPPPPTPAPTPTIPLPLPLPIPIPLPLPIPPLPIPLPPVPTVTITGTRLGTPTISIDALWLAFQLARNTPIGLAAGAAYPIMQSVRETGKGDFWTGLKPYRGKTKTNGKPGKQRRFYEWDHTHGDVEVYDSKGGHLGSVDGNSGDNTKPPVDGRKINL
jgi:RHS repeat-associated protein